MNMTIEESNKLFPLSFPETYVNDMKEEYNLSNLDIDTVPDEVETLFILIKGFAVAKHYRNTGRGSKFIADLKQTAKLYNYPIVGYLTANYMGRRLAKIFYANNGFIVNTDIEGFEYVVYYPPTFDMKYGLQLKRSTYDEGGVVALYSRLYP